MLVKRSTLSVYNIHVEVHIALGVAMSATDPPPTNALESSSWLEACRLWTAAMGAGSEGKGKTFGTPTLTGFGSAKGLMWCLDQGKGKGFGQPTLKGFGPVQGKMESLDSHDDYGKGKGKGKGQSELDESFLVWPEAAGKCKGKGFGKPTLAELDGIMGTCNPGVMGGSGAGEFTSGSGE